ncbi:YesL family protein [Pediococcus siamensis]|uniref:YesL family protein n=1 Tax=Pediococcus siamensis TaxID=381829 RepID=UPI0039A2DE55
MISLGLQKIFIRSYVLIKLSLLFWLYAFAGGLLLGIGPALLTIADLYKQHHWHYERIKVREGWQLFKHNFKRGNLYFYLFVATMTGLSYNLYLSVQSRGLVFILTDFIIIFGLLIVLSMFHFGIWLTANYELSFQALIKLAFIQFFNNFWEVIKLLAGLGAIFLLTYKFPGLILFGSIPGMLLWTAFVSKKWVTKLEKAV